MKFGRFDGVYPERNRVQRDGFDFLELSAETSAISPNR
jgi:hypothetical protein